MLINSVNMSHLPPFSHWSNTQEKKTFFLNYKCFIIFDYFSPIKITRSFFRVFMQKIINIINNINILILIFIFIFIFLFHFLFLLHFLFPFHLLMALMFCHSHFHFCHFNFLFCHYHFHLHFYFHFLLLDFLILMFHQLKKYLINH